MLVPSALGLPPSARCIRTLSRSLACFLPHRAYSFESGRNRKPDRSNKAQSSNDKPITDASPEPKPAITGHGRRHRARSKSPSPRPAARTNNPGLLLPFVPLPSDHLTHLRPKLLSLDQFFSLQRPLLEIEIPLSERRSITAESLLEPLGSDEGEPGPPSAAPDELITTGSPSDPTFKPPQMSTGGVSAPLGDEAFDDELWGTVDAYAPYLIAEPDGIDPAWPRALKHYLACTPAFVPPPVPIPEELEPPTVKAAQKNTREPTEEEERVEKRRLRDVQFLAPYGTYTAVAAEAMVVDPGSAEPANTTAATEESTLPGIPQDPQSLTLQAARFLHSGLTSFCWPGAVEWDCLREQLAAAEAAFEGQAQEQGSGKGSEVGPVRGSEPVTGPRRAAARWIKLTIEPAAGGPQTVTLDPQQLQRIIEYSEALVKQHLGRSSNTAEALLPKDLMASLENLGAYLAHKHPPRNGAIEALKISVSQVNETAPEGEAVEMDSVQRKRKRKMKVHKYKKRRKARRTLRKRHGRD